jgi:hypothetical protein
VINIFAEAWLEVQVHGKTATNFQALQLAFENSLAYPPTAPVRSLFRFAARFLRTPIVFAQMKLEKLAHYYHSNTRYNPPPPQVHKKKIFKYTILLFIFSFIY